MQKSKNLTKKSSVDKLCVHQSFIWSNGVTEISVGPRKSVKGPKNKARGPGILTVSVPPNLYFHRWAQVNKLARCLDSCLPDNNLVALSPQLHQAGGATDRQSPVGLTPRIMQNVLRYVRSKAEGYPTSPSRAISAIAELLVLLTQNNYLFVFQATLNCNILCCNLRFTQFNCYP